MPSFVVTSSISPAAISAIMTARALLAQVEQDIAEAEVAITRLRVVARGDPAAEKKLKELEAKLAALLHRRRLLYLRNILTQSNWDPAD